MARVLVIDDDEQVLDLMRLVLENAHHHVVATSSGRTALEIHRTEPAQVIVTDILMPDMDGLELITAVRRESPDARILAISGGGRIPSEDYLESSRFLGAERVLTKPIRPAALLRAVEQLLESR